MYIALKWLVSLAFTMWLAICFTDLYLKQSKILKYKGVHSRPSEFVFRNVSKPKKHSQHRRNPYSNAQGTTGLHVMMFIAGALAVSVFNKKQVIVTFAKQKFKKIDISAVIRRQRIIFKNTACSLGVVASKLCCYFWKNLMLLIRLSVGAFRSSDTMKQYNIYNALINRLKEMGEERKNLGQLLIAAIHENKNIRMRYQLETMTKNRLVQHIETTQKQIKENRSKYVSFQQLYLVTHQENNFLKSRIQKLTKEKEEAENNLMGLLNEVYKSTNNDLKAYCTRLLVRSKDNLLNSDVKEEIRKFLEKSRMAANSGSWRSSTRLDVDTKDDRMWSRYRGARVTELHEDSLVPTICDAPKLRGLPGECVWTVKDKNGIIEKLYEYDYESEFDNGDTMRRIRQYSVYYDKDCLLDFTNSLPAPEDIEVAGHYNVHYPIPTHRIVTGSEAFQSFLRNNKSIVPSKKSLVLRPSV